MEALPSPLPSCARLFPQGMEVARKIWVLLHLCSFRNIVSFKQEIECSNVEGKAAWSGQ